MSYFAKITFLFVSSIALIFTIGYWAGLSKYKCPEEIIKTEVKTKILSDRITACEEKGGKYSYTWSSYSEEYYESCYILSTLIEEF